MLDELRDMLVERLLVYEKKNRALPARIIVYRDGVSEVSSSIFISNPELSDKNCRVNSIPCSRKSFLKSLKLSRS
jgi:hypothetical protein